MRFRSPLLAIAATPLALAFTTSPSSGQAARRPMHVADVDGYRDVRDLDIAPDGAWVAYTVGLPDVARDKDEGDGGLSNQAGTEHVRLTTNPVPSYRRDRLQRYLDWFGKHLGGGTK